MKHLNNWISFFIGLNLLFVTANLLNGCGFVQTKNVDTVQVQQNIYNIAKEGTILAINNMFTDSECNLEEKLFNAGMLSKKIEHFALPLLSNPNVEITRQLESQLLEIVPEDLQGFMAVAYETLHSHYSFPTTAEILPEPYLSYLRAFLIGIKDGADSVLIANNAHVDTSHSIHTEDHNE